MSNVGAFAPRPWSGAESFDRVRSVPIGLGVATVAVLLGVPFPANLLVLATVVAFVIAMVAPSWGLALVVASIPIQAIGASQLGAVEVTVAKAVLAGVTAAWVGRLSWRRHALGAAGTRIALCYGAYVLAVALSVVNARGVSAWASEFYRWWSGLALFVVAASVLRGPTSVRPVVLGTTLGAAGTSVFGIYQVVVGAGPDSFSLGGLTRGYGTFGHPNPFAGYLGVTVPLLAAVGGGVLFDRRVPEIERIFGRRLPFLCAGVAAVGFVALVLTQSRGGWLGAVVGLGVVVWLLGGRARWVALVIVGLATVLSLATPVGGRVANRMATGVVELGPEVQVTAENFAVHERLAHMRAGMAMAREYPGLGVGAGNFSARFREFTPVWRFREARGHAHNAYVHVAAQTGVVGLVGYTGLLGAVAAALIGALRRVGEGAGRPLVVGAIGVSLAFATHNMVDYMHVLGLNLQLSVVWAMALAASRDGSDGATSTMGSAGAAETW